MKLKFIIPDMEYNIDSIMQFQDDSLSEYWSDVIFQYYPQIDKSKFRSLGELDKKIYLEECLTSSFHVEELETKRRSYQSHWDEAAVEIQQAFEEIFDLSLDDKLNGMTAYITANPICPRYLSRSEFDVFYLNSEKGALGISLHEMIHFIWFYVWQEDFNDLWEEYEQPSMKWVFSEMVVDTIMTSDERLYGKNPYASEGCAYDYFYTMTIDNEPILEYMKVIYGKYSIKEFMKQGYEYCLHHEEDIRKQMR